jgi:hypothetical protein
MVSPGMWKYNAASASARDAVANMQAIYRALVEHPKGEAISQWVVSDKVALGTMLAA